MFLSYPVKVEMVSELDLILHLKQSSTYAAQLTRQHLGSCYFLTRTPHQMQLRNFTILPSTTPCSTMQLGDKVVAIAGAVVLEVHGVALGQGMHLLPRIADRIIPREILLRQVHHRLLANRDVPARFTAKPMRSTPFSVTMAVHLVLGGGAAWEAYGRILSEGSQMTTTVILHTSRQPNMLLRPIRPKAVGSVGGRWAWEHLGVTAPVAPWVVALEMTGLGPITREGRLMAEVWE